MATTYDWSPLWAAIDKAIGDYSERKKYQNFIDSVTTQQPGLFGGSAPVGGAQQSMSSLGLQGLSPEQAKTLKSIGPAMGMMFAGPLLHPKEPIKLGKDDALYDPTTYKPIIQPRQEPLKLGASERLINPADNSTLIDVAPPQPNPNVPFDPRTGAPQKAYQDYEINKTKAGRPVTSVSVNAERSFGTQLGENAAKSLDATASAARGAVQTLQTVNQIKSALDTGNVTAGPGATAVQFFNQVAGGDPSKVVATRQTIQGLAQLALGARQQLKGQGQISDYEGKLLQKATSGDIDSMTVPEIRAITDVAERAARFSIHQNAQNVSKARAIPGSGNMVDFYDVPEPPAYQSQSNVDDLLKKYLGK